MVKITYEFVSSTTPADPSYGLTVTEIGPYRKGASYCELNANGTVIAEKSVLSERETINRLINEQILPEGAGDSMHQVSVCVSFIRASLRKLIEGGRYNHEEHIALTIDGKTEKLYVDSEKNCEATLRRLAQLFPLPRQENGLITRAYNSVVENKAPLALVALAAAGAVGCVLSKAKLN